MLATPVWIYFPEPESGYTLFSKGLNCCCNMNFVKHCWLFHIFFKNLLLNKVCRHFKKIKKNKNSKPTQIISIRKQFLLLPDQCVLKHVVRMTQSPDPNSQYLLEVSHTAELCPRLRFKTV